MADLRQSPAWANYMKDIGWEAVELEGGYAFIKKLGILGSIIKIPRLNPPIDFQNLNQLAKSQKALLIKLEPNVFEGTDLPVILKKNGFHEDNWSFAPTRTVLIDLSLSLEEIQAKMQKETRYAIRKAEEKNIECRILNNEENLENFLQVYRQTAKRGNFWVGSESELKSRWDNFSKDNQANLFLVYRNSQLLAGAIVFYQDITAYYYHAASTREGQKLNAPSLLIWEIIKEAKKRKLKLLDLEGLTDPRIPSTKNWKGFSAFKRTFGGSEVSYIGSFSKYYIPVIGSIFRLVQKLGI